MIYFSVKENETNLEALLVDVAKKYNFDDASQIFVTLDDTMSPKDRPPLPSNMRYVENVVFAINEVRFCLKTHQQSICRFSSHLLTSQLISLK